MRDFESGLTFDRLHETLRYTPATGQFRWLVSNSGRRQAGMIAGDKKADSGYILIGIDRVRYRAHRLAWLYMTGQWPAHQIDHINGIRSDNRWCNLREATQQQNSANMRLRSANSSGVKGVYWNKQRGKWCATLAYGRKQVHGGFYDDLNDAAAAYRNLAKSYFGEFARPERIK